MRYFYILDTVTNDCSASYVNCCTDYGLSVFLSLVKTFLNIVQIVAPIILLIFATLQFIQMMINPDDKKGMKSLTNKFMAAVIVIMLPTLVQIFMDIMPDNVDLSNCWKAADEVKAEIDSNSENFYSKLNEMTNDQKLVFQDSYARYRNRSKEASIAAGTIGDFPTTGLPIPLYLQCSYDISYGSGKLCNTGCGPTSLAMVLTYLTKQSITPDVVVNWAGNTYYSPGAGSKWTLFAAGATKFNAGTVTQTTSKDAVIEALKAGKPVISSQSSGIFTSGGHFIVLRGITSTGKILVNDPADNTTKNHVNREFNMTTDIHNTSKQYWIFNS